MINRDHRVTTGKHFTITEQVCSLLESFIRSRRDYSNLAILAWLRVSLLLSRTRQLARLFSQTPARHALAQTHKASGALLPSTSFARCLQKKKFKAIIAHGLVWAAFVNPVMAIRARCTLMAAGGKALALVLSYTSTGWDSSIRDH